MSRHGAGEAIVRIIEDEPTVSVQVSWKGAELNLLRAKEELIERFVQRLGISCSKHHCTGGERKKAKKEKKKVGGPDESGKRPEASSGVAVSIIDKDGAHVADGTPVVEALQLAVRIEIEGDHLPIRVNPPAIKKLEVFGRALAGCPLVASICCEFCSPASFRLKWMLQVPAGASEGDCLAEGRVVWLPKASGGQTLTLKAEPIDGEDGVRAAGIVRVGLVDEVPRGWPDRRIEAFGGRASDEGGRHHIRAVSFNTLAAPYARTISATRDMYPYCPATALDFAYRQPLLGRELARLDADVICLQECTYGTCWKFLTPLFGDKYHMRVTLKANKMSEGCCMMLRKEAFEVVEEQDFLFRELLESSPAFREVVSEVKSKWPDFLTGVLPHMSVVFQLSVVRHKASGTLMVIANTHLFFHPGARHIRLLQAMCLVQQVHELREKHSIQGVLPRLLLCGDLNCTPDQAVVQYLLEGKVASEHPDWEHAAEFRWEREEEERSPDSAELEEPTPPQPESSAAQEAGSREGMGLTLCSPLGALNDAYASEPLPFTNFVNGFNGTLDYILTGPGLLSKKRLLGVSEKELRPDGEQGGLPNELHPSDHVSIAVDLELV